jgi:hypothetical protein
MQTYDETISKYRDSWMIFLAFLKESAIALLSFSHQKRFSLIVSCDQPTIHGPNIYKDTIP